MIAFEAAAKIIYVLVLLWLILCLGWGNKTGRIDLWELATVTDKHGKVRTDNSKLYETGAFLVMTLTFCFLGVLDKLSEWYALIYVSAWVASRAMARKDKMADAKAPIVPGIVSTVTSTMTETK